MMKVIFSFAVTLVFLASAFGQTSQKSVTAETVFDQIEQGKNIKYENITVIGNLDLSKLPRRVNDAVYPEKTKTARVYTTTIQQPVTFKNVNFTGKVDFFRKDETIDEIKEYRLAFADAVIFENCTFNQPVDFELTNFDGGVSFAGSIFKAQPSFIRVGLQKAPNFVNTIFENGSVFMNFQNDIAQNLSAAQLSKVYINYLTAK